MKRTHIFNTVRSLIGRGFRTDEVKALDQAIDCAAGDDSACIQERDDALPRNIGPEGISLIKQFEGCARLRKDGLVEAYPDPGTGAEPWTIGWGATGHGITEETVWTREECDNRLENDLIRYAHEVARAIGDCPTTQEQFDAMVSFHYNTGAIGRATLTQFHRSGDYPAALAEFARWNRAGGRILKGLSRRRAAEAKVYSGGMPIRQAPSSVR